VAVIERVDHGHGPGSAHLIGWSVWLRKARILDEHRLLARHRTHHRGYAGVIAIADAHCLALGEIDAVEVLDEGGHEMLARLLAVTDDIDAGVLLLLQRQAQRIRLPSISSSPCSFQGDQSFSGSASQAGLAGCRRWRWAKFFTMENLVEEKSTGTSSRPLLKHGAVRLDEVFFGEAPCWTARRLRSSRS
jgi:hypothetical protein